MVKIIAKVNVEVIISRHLLILALVDKDLEVSAV